jgi:predicted nucleic acid-binding protein
LNLYIDSSALMKLVTPEDESDSLREFLAGANPWSTAVSLLSSQLAKTEIFRASARIGADARRAARDLARSVTFLGLDRPILHQAALVMPASLRTLDAIHVTTALWGGLAVIGYDHRLNEAAREAGLRVYSPGMSTSQ